MLIILYNVDSIHPLLLLTIHMYSMCSIVRVVEIYDISCSVS